MLPSLLLSGLVFFSFGAEASPDDTSELTDLTGGVVPIISYEQAVLDTPGGELFSHGKLSSRGEVRFSIRVRNQTGDPVVADSLIVIVDQIVEMARGRDVTTRLDIPGADGHTESGKPYFRVPAGDGKDLAPYAESPSFLLQINNPDLLRLSPPKLRILGIRRSAAVSVEKLRQLLIQKGILQPEETLESLDSSLSSTP